MKRKLSILALLLAAVGATAAEPPVTTATLAATTAEAKAAKAPASSAAKPDSGPKALSGMSILGNQDAPKALVIVPWKSSQLGDSLGIAKSLDDGRQPVDKDVFMRQLSYYQIRSNSK
jgi:hypothetical protein